MTLTASCRQATLVQQELERRYSCKLASFAHHLALLCSLLDLCYYFLLLVLQCHALTIELSDSFVQHAFVLPQEFCKKCFIRSQTHHVVALHAACVCQWQLLKQLCKDHTPCGVFFLPNNQDILCHCLCQAKLEQQGLCLPVTTVLKTTRRIACNGITKCCAEGWP